MDTSVVRHRQPIVVVVVAGDEALRDSIGALLEHHDFTVSEYGSAAEFLKLGVSAAALVLDSNLSEMDGVELAEILRMAGIATPIILMIDMNDRALAKRIRATSMCMKLCKPISPDVLLSAVQASCAAGASIP